MGTGIELPAGFHMTSEKKIKIVKEIVKDIEGHSVVGILNMHKLPGKQLHQIKRNLSQSAKIRMAKKSLIKLALEKAKKEKVKDLESILTGSPAILFSNSNPFELARIIDSAKSKTLAVAGDISPSDILIPAGDTGIPAGPAIGELQRAGLPVGVEGGKIAVKKDTFIVRKGGQITKEVAPILAKLGIEPMEIGLDLLAVWDNGLIFSKDILFVPQEKYIDDIKLAGSQAFNLSLSINYYTPENIQIFISKAHSEANSLALEAGVLNQDTIKPLLAKAHSDAEAVSKKVDVQ